MARTDNLSNFCTDIANAIRTKSNLTGTILASQFDTKISQIETGVDTSDATAVAGDILAGKTAYSQGNKITGTMNKGDFINGIIQEAKAQGVVTAGDFVTFINDYSNVNSVADKFISSYGNTISAIVLNTTTVFVAYSAGGLTSFLYGVICKISENNISYGNSTILSGAYYCGKTISVTKLSSSKVLIAHTYVPNSNYPNQIHLYAIVCTISGTSITAGTDTKIVSNSEAGRYNIQAITLTSNKVIILHRQGEYTSQTNAGAIVCTISGTTITAGTGKSLQTGYCLGATSMFGIALSESKVLVAYRDNGIKLAAQICTISGTAITVGTETQLSTIEYSGLGLSIAKLEENKAIISHQATTDGCAYAIVCTISGTTITAGTDTKIGITPTTSGDSNFEITTSIVAIDANTIFAFYSYNTDYMLYGVLCLIDGTNISIKRNIQLSSVYYSGKVISAAILDKNNIFVAHSKTADYQLYGTLVDSSLEVLIKKITSSAEEIKGIAIASATSGQLAQIKKPNV